MYQQQGYTVDAVMPAALETGRFTSLVTLQQPTGEQTADGSPLLAGGDSGDGWNNITGLIQLFGMNAPESDARIRADQTKSIDMVEGIQLRHLLLGGYYPAIQEDANWRAYVTDLNGNGGTYYDLKGVESDSQFTQTRLKLQISDV